MLFSELENDTFGLKVKSGDVIGKGDGISK
jgi:hypothetical protein